MKTVQKPLVVAMRDAENALVKSVNEVMKSGVPLYLLEMILDKIHKQIKEGADRELNRSMEQYALELANAEKEDQPAVIEVEEEKAGDTE